MSWVTIRDIRFRNRVSGNSPILGVAQVIHERKIQMHHELAWQIITNLIPEFGTAKLVATSDDEFTGLLEKFIKKGLVSKCEIHAVKKIERWVTNHGGRKREECLILKNDFSYDFI